MPPFRIVRTEDLETVRRLHKTCFPHDADMQADTYAESMWWLAEDDDEPVGFAGLYLGIPTQAWLVRVGVVPGLRGHGLGARLLRARLRAAKRLVGAPRRVVTYVADWNTASNRNLISAGLCPYRAEGGWIYYELAK